MSKLNRQFPIAESCAGVSFRNLATQIQNGGNPDNLIDLKSLSSLERAFYLQGYNSGALDSSLRRLADVIDFDQSNLFRQ